MPFPDFGARPLRPQQEISQSVALRQGCLLSPRHLRPRWRSHHHDRHRDKPKREEDRFLRKDHVAIEISEERPDAKLSRRQPLEKATAEIPDEEKGQSQTYVGFEPARETHFSRNGYRAIRDARIDGLLTGNQERMVQRKILSARCPTSVT